VAGNKPTAAFVLSLIGGILILLGAVFLMVVMSVLSGFAGSIPGMPAGATDILLIYGVVGLIFALLVLVGAVMMWARPQQHVAWGVVVLLFSLFSFISGGGFLLGLILGLVGGILGIVWKPSMPMPAPMMQQPMPPQ